jgi:hypothetical protein
MRQGYSRGDAENQHPESTEKEHVENLDPRIGVSTALFKRDP